MDAKRIIKALKGRLRVFHTNNGKILEAQLKMVNEKILILDLKGEESELVQDEMVKIKVVPTTIFLLS